MRFRQAPPTFAPRPRNGGPPHVPPARASLGPFITAATSLLFGSAVRFFIRLSAPSVHSAGRSPAHPLARSFIIDGLPAARRPVRQIPAARDVVRGRRESAPRSGYAPGRRFLRNAIFFRGENSTRAARGGPEKRSCCIMMRAAGGKRRRGRRATLKKIERNERENARFRRGLRCDHDRRDRGTSSPGEPSRGEGNNLEKSKTTPAPIHLSSGDESLARGAMTTGRRFRPPLPPTTLMRQKNVNDSSPFRWRNALLRYKSHMYTGACPRDAETRETVLTTLVHRVLSLRRAPLVLVNVKHEIENTSKS